MDKLVNGKSDLQGIVGIEVKDESIEIFTQGSLGTISSIFKSNRFFILASSNLDGKFTRLDGDLHFKWGRQFDNKSTWGKMRSIWKQQDIFSIYNAEEATMTKDGYTFYKGLKQKDVSLLSWDIETTGLDGNADDAKVLLISTTYRDQHQQVNRLFSYDDYEDEAGLLDAFSEYIQKTNPSLIIGHNIFAFDMSYMKARADHCGTNLFWGRDGSDIEFENYESKFRLDGTRDLLYNRVKIYGREIVDTFFLANSYDVSKSIESYALKPMIKQLGLEKEGRQYYDAGDIRKNYKNLVEWEKIKQYAIDDAEDPVKLWDLMSALYFNMAQMFPKPFTEILLSASGSKINGMMCRAYLQDGHSLPKADEIQKYQGALSFAVPGIYSNCFKIDLAALYPSIMIEYEVYDDTKDTKGYLLQLVKIFRSKRLEYKKLALETGDDYWKEMDTTAKSILNSFYGFMGTPGLNFNSFSCAEFITEKGREILEYTIKWASNRPLTDFIQDDKVEEEEAI
jgi:DNA polymerase elongation subunit (family B)